jgi:hypothetical protein
MGEFLINIAMTHVGTFEIFQSPILDYDCYPTHNITELSTLYLSLPTHNLSFSNVDTDAEQY